MSEEFKVTLENGESVDACTINMEKIKELIESDPDLFPEIQTDDSRILGWCQMLYDRHMGRGGTVLLMDSKSGRQDGCILLMAVCEEENGIKKYPLYNFVPFTPTWHLVKYLD